VQELAISRVQKLYSTDTVRGSPTRTTTLLQLHGQALDIILFVHINANLAPLTASDSRA
jgi:hypothetical protein